MDGGFVIVCEDQANIFAESIFVGNFRTNMSFLRRKSFEKIREVLT